MQSWVLKVDEQKLNRWLPRDYLSIGSPVSGHSFHLFCSYIPLFCKYKKTTAMNWVGENKCWTIWIDFKRPTRVFCSVLEVRWIREIFYLFNHRKSPFTVNNFHLVKGRQNVFAISGKNIEKVNYGFCLSPLEEHFAVLRFSSSTVLPQSILLNRKLEPAYDAHGLRSIGQERNRGETRPYHSL